MSRPALASFASKVVTIVGAILIALSVPSAAVLPLAGGAASQAQAGSLDGHPWIG